MISIISPLPRDSWGRWNNLDNATNLNDIWQDLNLPADSRLSEYKSREGLHFALYVVSESPETGVLIRIGLAQYKFTLLGWSCDGFENYLTFEEPERHTDLIHTFMSALGLEYAENPTPEQSVALARKLCDLDTSFKKVFDEYFIFDEIAENYHDLLIQLSETKNELRSEKERVANLNDTIDNQQTMLVESKQLLQRVLINQHMSECKKLLEQSADLDKLEDAHKKSCENYEHMCSIVTHPDKWLRRCLAESKNLYDGARYRARSFHDKEIRRIFGEDAVYIDYTYMKFLLSQIK